MSNYKEMNKEEINSLINDPKTTKNEIFQILCSVSDEIDQDDSYLLDLKKADLITQAHKILSYAEKFSLIENIQNEKTSLNTWDYRTMLLIAFLKSDKSKDVLCQTALGQNYWKIDCFLMFNIIGELEHDPSLNMDFDNALIDTILENRAAEKPPLSGIVDIKEYTAHVSSLFKMYMSISPIMQKSSLYCVARYILVAFACIESSTPFKGLNRIISPYLDIS